jgi:hypothetical protein
MSRDATANAYSAAKTTTPKTNMPSHHKATTVRALNSISSPQTATSAGGLEEAASPPVPPVSGPLVAQATWRPSLARLGGLM